MLTFSDSSWLMGSFSHWVVYNLPPETRRLPENVLQQKQLPNGARQGLNDVGHIGYYGPCPSFGSGHRYVFRLYALDSRLTLPPDVTQREVEAAIRRHVLAQTSLDAPYARPHSD